MNLNNCINIKHTLFHFTIFQLDSEWTNQYTLLSQIDLDLSIVSLSFLRSKTFGFISHFDIEGVIWVLKDSSFIDKLGE